MSRMPDALVRVLAGERGKAFPLGELAARLNVDVPELRAGVGELLAVGFHLVYDGANSIYLADEPERVEPREIAEGLRRGEFGWRTEWNWAVGSTQEEAARLVGESAPEGTVVIAEAQTQGRGRGGHRWFSPLGGIWLSVLMGPVTSATEASQSNLAAAVAVAGAVRREAGVPALIKWPNDITVNGKKLGGILTELEWAGKDCQWAVLGVGLNVNIAQGDFPGWLGDGATSLLEVLGKRVDRTALIRGILRELKAARQLLGEKGLAPVLEAWRSLSAFWGRQVVVEGPEGREVVQAVDVDSDGALIVRTSEGIQRRYLAGEVELVS